MSPNDCAGCGTNLSFGTHRPDCPTLSMLEPVPLRNEPTGTWISFVELNALKAQLNEARELAQRLMAALGGKAA